MTAQADRIIRLRYPSTCRRCGAALDRGCDARWDPVARTASCVACPGAADPFEPIVPPPSGVAGRSAQAEGDRRTADREARIRKRFPRVGGLVLALTEPPPSTTSWGQGAVGELTVAARLARPAADGTIAVLHDRRVPGSKANIDHLVVGPAGVHVIDTKRYVGKKVERRVGDGLFDSGPARLFVGGRDRTHLVDAMHRQAEVVRGALDGLAATIDLEVVSVLCFVDGEWSLLSGPFEVCGTHVTGPRGLVRLVTRSGPLGSDDRMIIAHHLARELPEA